MPLFNVLSPFAVSIDADKFSSAAKKFVEMQRSLDITRLILADRFNNTMKADVVYTKNKDDNYRVAKIDDKAEVGITC